jgi:leader peptidase (prepilin peptidase)/N-methyltransferase
VSDQAIWALALGGLGAIAGSFLATLVIRWPEGREMNGRSACDTCGRTLKAWELIPLLSAAALRGRCRECGAAIDPTHIGVEAACLVVGVTAGWFAPGIQGAAGAVFGWLLVTLAMLDWRAFWLPDRLVLPLALAGLAGGVAGLAPALVDRLLGGAGGFGVLWGVATAYRRMRGREGIGGGDPKLFGAIGLWLGWQLLPAVLLVSGLVGLGIVAFRAVARRPMAGSDPLPLGTLLAVAAYPAWIAMVALTP